MLPFPPKFRIFFTCGREPEYTRNMVLQKSLGRYFDLRNATSNMSLLPLRYVSLAEKLITNIEPMDGIVVGFYGQPLMLLTRVLPRRPVLFDAFISTYDTLCFDRKRFSPQSLLGRLAFWLDRTSCNLANMIILDTQAHIEYFNQIFGIPTEKCHRLFVGCNEDIFYPRLDIIPPEAGEIMSFSSYMPLHGTETIIKAASLLRDDRNIHFRLFGRGMEYVQMKELADRMALKNVSFFPAVSQEQLACEISHASICLGGHFGISGKASRVIAGKTFICMAMGKPLIVGDNPANHELLTQDYDAAFCQMANPMALAEAIRELVGNTELRERLGKNAHQTFLERASISVLSMQLKEMVETLVH